MDNDERRIGGIGQIAHDYGLGRQQPAPAAGAVAMAGVGANLNRGVNVAVVAMPLVRLMRDGGLSWSDKQEVAGVIRALLNDKQSMDAEQRHIAGAVAGAAGAGLAQRN